MKGKELESPWILMVIVAILVCLPVPDLRGQSQHTEHTLTLDAEGPPAVASVADVAWLAGHWRGEGFGGTTEEIWAAPMGRAMIGTFRLVKADTPVFYELLTIVEEQGSFALRLKHFQPDLTGWEEKDGSTAVVFRLVKVAPNEVYFRGLTFRKPDADHLEIFLALRQKDGAMKEEHFSMTRVKE